MSVLLGLSLGALAFGLATFAGFALGALAAALTLFLTAALALGFLAAFGSCGFALGLLVAAVVIAAGAKAHCSNCERNDNLLHGT
jgi:hypothetical protein